MSPQMSHLLPINPSEKETTVYLRRSDYGLTSFHRLIIASAESEVIVRRSARRPQNKLVTATHLYNQGVQFFVPVRLNTKLIAWQRGREVPVRLETVERLLTSRRLVKTQHRLRYDLAVRTGKWALPDRNRDKILVVLDIDDWAKTPETIKDIITKTPTFTVRTSRGFHFYFWVSHWFSRSGSNPGIADWQARGRIAVLTGADRLVLSTEPIRTLQDEEAAILHKFATTPLSSQGEVPRWGIHTITDLERNWEPGQFEAVQGERNYRINGELYRQRHELSESELIEKALSLAAQCTPPYPEEEARQIAQSIIRNRHRFPVGPGLKKGKTTTVATPTYTLSVPDYSGDHHYLRLAVYFGQEGQQFTRAEYEAKLAQDGWKKDKRGRIEVARQDIEHNLKLGEIRECGRLPSGKKGGNRAKVYERVRSYQGKLDHLLPGKLTPKTIRLAVFLYLLPDIEMEVVRATIKQYIGVKSNETITRYGRELARENQWGDALIEKRIQKPLITDRRLNPRYVLAVGDQWPLPREEYQKIRGSSLHYRPSLYRRTDYYKLIRTARFTQAALAQGRPKPKPQSSRTTPIKDAMSELVAQTQSAVLAGRFRLLDAAAPSQEVAKATYHEPCNKTTEKTTTPIKVQCRGCKKAEISPNSANSENLCANCLEKVEQIRALRLESLAAPRPESALEHQDFCEKCRRFYITDQWPLPGVCPKCEDKYFRRKWPTVTYYCPHPGCGTRITTAHYIDWARPEKCPGCQNSVAHSAWSRVPPVPPESLPGYPVNYYTMTGQTLFQVMDEYRSREDFSFVEFREMFTDAEYQAWHTYRLSLYKEVNCVTCGEMFRVPPEKAPRTHQCQRCESDAFQNMPIDPEAEAVIQGYKSGAYFRLLELHYRLFKRHPRAPHEINVLIKRYSVEWVEWAMRTSGRIHAALQQRKPKKRIHTPVPHIIKILENWHQQGYPNRKDQALSEAESLAERLQERNIVTATDRWAAAKDAPNVYLAYHYTMGILTPSMARLIKLAIDEYGEAAVRYAISEAASQHVQTWNYCTQILERIKKEGLP